MNLDRRQFVSLLSIPLVIAVITALFLLDVRTVFEPPFALAILNTVFLGIIPLFIALVAYQSYRSSGAAGILLLGAGMLVFGLGSIAAGWLNGLPGGANITPSVHNISVCIGSVFSLAAAVLVLSGFRAGRPRRSPVVPVLLYGSIAIAVTAISVAAVLGLIPPFFVQGAGPTTIRQVILSNATGMYALASILFFLHFARRRDSFFFWFSIALALIAVGNLAVLLQPAVGSLIGWTGRAAQYAGACFALAAFVDARRFASHTGILLRDQIGSFFDGEETTRAVLSATDESIWMFDTDGTVLMANPTAIERLGRGDVTGLRMPDILQPALAQARMEHLAEVARTRRMVKFEDERDGIFFEHTFNPVFDRSGAVTAVVSFSRDVTERKVAEETLKSYMENLQRSNRELEDFAYIASHDLREPLRMVTMFSELLRERYRGRLDQDADEFIEYIVQGGIKMDALISDLLDYSRVTTRAKPFGPVRMDEVLAEVIRILSPAISESGAVIRSGILPEIVADRSQMAQVFQNLIGNAIKFRTKEPPEIVITADEQGEETVFAVKDNGIGIDPDFHGKIFEIFERLHSGNEFPGTGIGLAICRRIVERHGGRIWVESGEGKGSTFYFSIPARKAPAG